MSRRRYLAALLPAVLALSAVSGCDDGGGKGGGSGSGSGASAPRQDAGTTLKQASDAMAKLSSVRFNLSTEDNPQITVKSGDMKLLKNGDADGTVQVAQSGNTVELKLVSLGDSVYIDAGTGGWRKVPKMLAATMYDPSAVLDPDRGIAKLLTSVTSPKAEATEKVNGEEADRVAVVLPKTAIGGVIPGVTQDIPGKVWVGTADHRLLKVQGRLPRQGGGGTGTVTIDFTEFDKPYKIVAPK
ncbi:LppX_LprAFG lipoprotein [Actinomadura parmotrematis]|uniref:LppX_LprAFG lipoprotein n=1 Tax=Actinomadura parmotrematis TaxID=2864039 RepID=A0ABS7FK55_9ACTN|nr:LppX_LprAFG lipoprotein [Actinomadura parmotrematis]MBW8480733.1 LppX_LprAFG lipoprotein [Actinomadura parmotrematis]